MIYKNFQNNVNKVNASREVELFKCLLGAINAESNAYAWEQHGSKGFVDFIFSSAINNLQRTFCTCEIADILFVFIVNDKTIRYSFMQNKKISPLNNTFSVDLKQWDLLYNKSKVYPYQSLTKKNKNAKRKYPVNILSSAILDSVTSYGVFNQNTGTYDMRYYIANQLKFNRANQKTVNVFFNPQNFNKIQTKFNYKEVLGTMDLNWFDFYLNTGKIGTPLLLNNNEDNNQEIVKFFKGLFEILPIENDKAEKLVDKAKKILRSDKREIKDTVLVEKIPFNVVLLECTKKIIYYTNNSSSVFSKYLKDLCKNVIIHRPNYIINPSENDNIVIVDKDCKNNEIFKLYKEIYERQYFVIDTKTGSLSVEKE